MSTNTPISIPSSSNFPPHIRLERIEVFSTADRNTAARYLERPAEQPPGEVSGYDVTLSFAELTLNESVFSLAVTGQLIVIDNFGFIEDARINGQEKIMIQFSRYNTDEQTYDSTFSREFYVTGISALNREYQRAQIVFDFASPHVIIDKLKRVGRAYGYTDMAVASNATMTGAGNAIGGWNSKYAKVDVQYHDPNRLIGEEGDLEKEFTGANEIEMIRPELFIYHILTHDLRIPKTHVFLYGYHPNDSNENDHSVDRMKVIVPNWRPFQAIKWLLRNTFSESVYHPWFCYETVTSGMRIEPFSMLIASDASIANLNATGRVRKEMTGEYYYNRLPGASADEKEYYNEISRQILSFSSASGSGIFQKYRKLSQGAYGSQEWAIDIATKFSVPNQSSFIDKTQLSYSEIIDNSGGESLLPYPPFPVEVDTDAPDYQQSNYTYYSIYNSAMHGTTLRTFPYNRSLWFEDGAPSQIGVQTAPLQSSGDPSANPTPSPLSGDVIDSSQYTRTSSSVGVPQGDFNTYRKTVAYIESTGSGGYAAVGGSGNHYEGAYQMGKAAKTDAARILGISVPSREQFLSNPDLQERMFDAYTMMNHKTLMRVNSKYRSLPPKEKLAVLGYAHNQGAGGASEWINSGISRRDGFNTDASKYYNAVAGNLGIEGTLFNDDGDTPTPTPPPPSDDGGDSNPFPQTVAKYSTGVEKDPKTIGLIARKGDMIRKNLDTFAFEMTVRGDFRLNPGMIINITIQKTVDKTIAENMEGRRDEGEYTVDRYLSGKYFVLGSTHSFKKDGFFTKVLISRDSSDLSLDNEAT